jgi:hypothetical protein
MPGKPIGASATWHATGGDYSPALRVMVEARKDGLNFDQAWPAAVEACGPSDRSVLIETSSAWRLEYEGQRSWGGDLIGALAVLDHDVGQRDDNRILA